MFETTSEVLFGSSVTGPRQSTDCRRQIVCAPMEMHDPTPRDIVDVHSSSYANGSTDA
jgi:hypothetical protein